MRLRWPSHAEKIGADGSFIGIYGHSSFCNTDTEGARIEDWLRHLPLDGVRAMCSWEGFCAFAREARFAVSREGAGSRTLVKKRREEGIVISRWRVMKLMQEEGLDSCQRRAYKVTTKPRKGAEVAPNLLNQNFNPPGPDQVWVSDITYLKTGEGWLYFAAIMDLYSRRIVGRHVDKRMTSSLVCSALTAGQQVTGHILCGNR